jgi:hypothetical protein
VSRRFIRVAAKPTDPLRLTLAQEAARIMADHGVDDFLLAKRKAADRLRVRDQSALPSNVEIATALAEHHRLFQASTHPNVLRDLRQTAIGLMKLLTEFEPRLVGAVLDGTATKHSEINVHVFADQAETVAMRLMEYGISAKHAEKKLRYEAERIVSYPSFKFVAGHHPLEVVVLSRNDLRQAPLSPVDAKPMARATLPEVHALL